jgi:galactokinase
MSLKDRMQQAFHERFGEKPRWLLRAPGRVNLIGEHTDYNDGYVLPMAIDRWMWLAIRPREDRLVLCRSLDFDEPARFSLDRLEHGDGGWGEYLKGVAWAMQEEGAHLIGWEGVLAGEVPIGAGLSSSAALEMAAGRAFALAAEKTWEPEVMVHLCLRAEREWVGVNCGIMDQMIIAMGVEDHGLLIDCRTLETTNIPLPEGCSVLVLDTGTRRGLRESAYNERRRQCERAARHFGVPALRDVTLAHFLEEENRLEDVVRRRARHVISENERTLQAAHAMRSGDPERFGSLMDASHRSLREDFEVSSPALDAMVDLARREPGCHGARLTGAGFAGCAIALVAADEALRIAESVTAAYRKKMNVEPEAYVCRAVSGVEVVGPQGRTGR